ncbi:MAG: hypothetical protein OXI91_11540 [Chloroflexota bacterium]|nr:hypothetical protein [Chloroflexota bacterium]
MVKAWNDADAALEVNHHPEIEPDAPLSKVVLLDLRDALVEERGRAPTTERLGMNQRTVVVCCGCRQASRRVRQALPEFRDAGSTSGASASVDGGRSSMTVNDDTGSNLHGCPASV